MGKQVFVLPSSVEELTPNPKVKNLAAAYSLSRTELASGGLSRNSDPQQSNYRTTVFL